MQLVAIRREYKIKTVVFFIEINYLDFFIFQSYLPNYSETLSAFHKMDIFDFVEIQPTYYLYLQNTFTTQIKIQMKHLWSLKHGDSFTIFEIHSNTHILMFLWWNDRWILLFSEIWNSRRVQDYLNGESLHGPTYFHKSRKYNFHGC